MAMTKAEQKAMDDLRRARDLARALRWPDYPAPERSIVADSAKTVTGFDFNEYRAREGFRNDAIFPAWSTLSTHGEGERDKDGGAQQNSRDLYPDKRSALKALRYALTEKYAEALARIDELIDQEGGVS